MRRLALLWIGVLAVCVGLTAGLDVIGAPSPSLFAGLAAGLLFALVQPVRLGVPGPVNHSAFAVTGVVIGELLTLEVLRSLADDSLPVLASLVVTLALTVLAGLLLTAMTPLDRPTAVFGMIAGGASGVIAISEDAGADARLVAVMQYLRVLVVLVTLPLVTGIVLASSGGGEDGAGGAHPAFQPGALFLLVVGLVGAGLGRLARLPSSSLLGPMLLAGGIALAAPDLVRGIPEILQLIAFGVIGLQVGLRFDAAGLRLVARSLLPVLLMIAGLLIGCAGFAVVMAEWTDRPFYDCYLATTPGGLYAVAAAAVQAGADGAFVTSVQVLRLFAVLLAAPLLSWFIRRSGARSG